MRNIAKDTVIIMVLGLILIASILYIQQLPPYVTPAEKFILTSIPFVLAVIILLIVLY